MKIQVYVKNKASAEVDCMLDLSIGVNDTISSVKERVTALQMIPFPEQDLILDGEVLDSAKRISDCNVTEGTSLDLVVNATEAVLVDQLKALLQARDLSPDELGLLYCYKHGVNVNQAMKMIGQDGKLPDLLRKQKSLLLENGRVTLVREDTALKPFSAAEELAQILKSSGVAAMDVKELSSRFIQKFNTSITSITGMKPSDFFSKEQDTFYMVGRNTVSLKAPTSAPPAAKVTKPAPAAPPGLEEETSQTAEVRTGGTSTDAQQYMDLHNRICTRGDNSKLVQALSSIVDAISEASFLDIHHVVKGGSVGNSTAISGMTDAEVVFFLNGLPIAGHDQWTPSLVKAAAGMIKQSLGDDPSVSDICAAEDSVQLRVKGIINLSVRFSPVFETYTQAIQTLGCQGPVVRKYFNSSLLKERTQFISKQPSAVKVTIRLMKWWRDQQDWSSKLLRPSNEILELIAIYSAVQTKPADQRMAIANVMSLLSRFNELKVIWSNFYSKEEVWSPLLSQRPLLMDPTNPFVNIADPITFDAREVMSLAKTTKFFW